MWACKNDLEFLIYLFIYLLQVIPPNVVCVEMLVIAAVCLVMISFSSNIPLSRIWYLDFKGLRPSGVVGIFLEDCQSVLFACWWRSRWDLGSPTRIRSAPPVLEGDVLTTGPPAQLLLLSLHFYPSPLSLVAGMHLKSSIWLISALSLNLSSLLKCEA